MPNCQNCESVNISKSQNAEMSKCQYGDVPFVIVNRLRQGRSLSRRGVPGHVRVYLDAFGYTSMLSHEIYDIGTKILLLNDHNSTQKAPKSIIPEEIKSAGHSPSSDRVISRFKAIFKKRPLLIRKMSFLWIFATGG